MTQKWAYFGIPHMGGTYTVFLFLRSGLAKYNIDVQWIGLGKEHHDRLCGDSQWESEHKKGQVVAPGSNDDKENANVLVDFLINEKFTGVFVNVLADRVQMNMCRYLSNQIKKVMLVHNISRGTYAAALELKNYVHATIGVSLRIQQDLINNFSFTNENTFFIPNAIESKCFELPRNTDANSLRLLSLGRIENASKGVFLLPEILNELKDIPFSLTVAGDGPDLAELKRRLAKFSTRVVFLGRVSQKDVPKLYATHDIFLFPSYYEGLPLALLESIATGCIPVASRITGITDYIVEHENSGFIFPRGNTKIAASMIRKIYNDSHLKLTLSTNARNRAREVFDIQVVTKSYSEVLEHLSEPKFQPLNIKEWKFPKGFRPHLTTFLPDFVKVWLRKILLG